MRLQLGRSWRRSLSTSLVLVASAGAIGATAGCSRHQETVLNPAEEAATLGQVRLNLTATSANGVVYRLSNATFEITSTTSSEQVTISTDEHPEDSVLLIDLPADDYEVELQPGWVLSTVEETGGPSPSARRRAAKPVPFSALRAAVERPNDAASEPAPASSSTLGTVVDAELISDNPVAVTVVAEELALVSFVFRANGEVIDTGAGTLGIGFQVEDEPADACVDALEPNDSPEQAAPIVALEAVSASLCTTDVDFYRFDPGVAPGTAFTATVSFSHAEADIDAFLSTSDGVPVDAGTSVTDNEVLTGVANGGEFILQVFPFSIGNSAVSYSVLVGPPDPQEPPANSCCEASGTPGCSEPVVNECVCALDPFCCEVEFDDICVEQAITSCEAQCEAPEPEPQSDCCSPSTEPACAVPEVSACVCELDAFCCEVEFDAICTEIAASECGMVCSG